MTILPRSAAVARFSADRQLLLDIPVAELAVRRDGLGEPLESLHDVLAHVLMWDEINLAVLTEARAGRAHWSLDARWETPAAGRLLNAGGVLAARDVPGALLAHRFRVVTDAVRAELTRYTEEEWLAPIGLKGGSVGGLAQYVMTGPDEESYRHAIYHLDRG
ncbi:hypothetical protein [Longispora albida]|uniref:hypothetical protein n=1 Tax=Longispora albida TaxID=203523 RepID=UPI000373C5CC|nr:hypothetical protein [Longispora albida]